MKRVLITGATGFMGRSFVRRFPREYEYFGLTRRDPADCPDLPVRWIRHDLSAPIRRRDLPRRVDAVLHLAGLMRLPKKGEISAFHRIHVSACAALIEYARDAGARKFLYASTGGVYGHRRTASRESFRPRPFDAYTSSKHLGEEIARGSGIAHVAIVRYFFIYGPGQTNGLMPRLAGLILRRQPVLIYNESGQPLINPIEVTDAAILTRRALEAGRSIVVNAAGPEILGIRALAAHLGVVLGRKPRFRLRRDPGRSNMIGGTRLAERQLGFRASVRCTEGIRGMFEGSTR